MNFEEEKNKYSNKKYNWKKNFKVMKRKLQHIVYKMTSNGKNKKNCHKIQKYIKNCTTDKKYIKNV